MKTQYLTVGSKDESFGNQIAQYDGSNIIFRVPYALEAKYGKYIHAPLKFPYKPDWIEDALKNNRALTYRIYAKNLRWFIACSTEVPESEKTSYSSSYGCICLDINPQVIGYARVDRDGNLREKGQIKFNLHSKSQNQQLAILHNVCHKVSPAYSSLIGLVKYLKLYGMSSDTAAAIVLARRAMRLSERVPLQVAYPIMTMGKYVWSAWRTLNKKLNNQLCLRRHSYFSLPNRELEVMLEDEFLAIAEKGFSSKRKRPSRIR